MASTCDYILPWESASVATDSAAPCCTVLCRCGTPLLLCMTAFLASRVITNHCNTAECFGLYYHHQWVSRTVDSTHDCDCEGHLLVGTTHWGWRVNHTLGGYILKVVLWVCFCEPSYHTEQANTADLTPPGVLRHLPSAGWQQQPELRFGAYSFACACLSIQPMFASITTARCHLPQMLLGVVHSSTYAHIYLA